MSNGVGERKADGATLGNPAIVRESWAISSRALHFRRYYNFNSITVNKQVKTYISPHANGERVIRYE